MKDKNSRYDIVKRLLKEAGYYWADEDENAKDPIKSDDYDPVVEKLFQANAIELERLYADINNSRREVMQALSQVILPEHYALPEPGYLVAQINPQFSRLEISPTDSFEIIGRFDTGIDYTFFFTSLFEQEFPKCRLIYTLTDAFLLDVSEKLAQEIPLGNGASSFKNTNFLWLGLDIEKMEPDDQITFFLGNKIEDTYNRNYSLFHHAKWYLNGDYQLPCKISIGLHEDATYQREEGAASLIEKLNVLDNYRKKIIHRFKNSFLTLSQINSSVSAIKKNSPPGFEHISELTKPLLWIKLEFDLPIPNAFLKETRIYPNSILLINRKLREEYMVKKDFNRLLLPLPTDHLFLGMESVKDEKVDYKPIDNFSPDDQEGTYLLRRSDSIRRLNSKDVLKQIQDLLDLVYEEKNSFREKGVNRLIQDFKFIDEAIARIRKSHSNGNEDTERNTDYYAIANIRKGAYTISYRYWECQGELTNRLGNKTMLEIKSSDVSIDDSFTLIPFQPGRDALKEEDHFNLLKSNLLSRNRIVTRGDIEIFCFTQYKEIVSRVEISYKIMSSPINPSFKEKAVLVTLTIGKQLPPDELELLKDKIQNELNIKTAFFTPIIIQFDYDG